MRRVPGFPFWTHLIAAAVVAVWEIGGLAHSFGIVGEWWDSAMPSALFVTLMVSTVVVLPAVLLETLALVLVPQRWVARVALFCFLPFAWYVSFFYAGFRLAGDTEPALLDRVLVSLIAFCIVMTSQALMTYVASSLWLERRLNRLVSERSLT